MVRGAAWCDIIGECCVRGRRRGRGVSPEIGMWHHTTQVFSTIIITSMSTPQSSFTIQHYTTPRKRRPNATQRNATQRRTHHTHCAVTQARRHAATITHDIHININSLHHSIPIQQHLHVYTSNNKKYTNAARIASTTQHAATRSNTQQHAATRSNTQQHATYVCHV